MDSGMIGKIEKAIRYAQERDRFRFQKFYGASAGDTQYAHRFVRRGKAGLHVRVLWNARRRAATRLRWKKFWARCCRAPFPW